MELILGSELEPVKRPGWTDGGEGLSLTSLRTSPFPGTGASWPLKRVWVPCLVPYQNLGEEAGRKKRVKLLSSWGELDWLERDQRAVGTDAQERWADLPGIPSSLVGG